MDEDLQDEMSRQLIDAIAESAYAIADHCEIPSYLVPRAVIMLAVEQWIGSVVQDMRNPAARAHFDDFITGLRGMVLSTLNDFADAVQRGGEIDPLHYKNIDEEHRASFEKALKGCTEYGHKMALMYMEAKGNS